MPPSHFSTFFKQFGPVTRLAWIPVSILLTAIVLLWAADLDTPHPAPLLLLSFNFLFGTLVSLIIAGILANNFMIKGEPELLFFGSGLLFYGLARLISSIAGIIISPGNPVDPNACLIIVTICVWLSALCHIGGILFSRDEIESLRMKSIWLLTAYSSVIVITTLVSAATVAGVMPLFFIQGAGGTTIRQVVMTSCTGMFVATALFLLIRRALRLSTYWYSLGLLLIATGLTGMMLLSVFDGPLHWASRFSQYIGGMYLLVSAIIAVRESGEYEISLKDALHTSQEKLLLFFEHAPAAVAMFDRKMRYIHTSRLWLEDYNLQGQNVTGRSHYEVFPEIPERWKEIHQRCLAGTTEKCDEDLFVREDGSVNWLRWEVLPWRERDGSIGGLIITSEDITDRKRAEERLKELTRTLSYHVDNSPLAVIEFDPDMRLVRWSGQAEHIFGWTSDEVLGKRMDEFKWVFENDATHGEEISDVLMNGAESHRFSYNRNYRKDGSIVHCEWYNSSMVDEAGELKSILSLVLDITERKGIEEELVRSRDKLEQRVEERTAKLYSLVKEMQQKDHMLLQQSRLAAMGEMINNIAHQWRQPLNTLGLNIQNLPLFYDAGMFDRKVLATNVEDSMRLIQHMSRTIDDFMHFFQPDREKVAFSVAKGVSDALKLIDATFRNKNIELALGNMDNSLVRGFPNEYAQVVLNILSNAKDAFVTGKTEKPQVFIAVSERNGKSVVTIRDNAGGIPEDILFKIFEPHFTTKGPQGTGIGLFMSKNIIEKNMNGSLTARNVNGGAEFRIEVPLIPADTSSP